MNIQQKKRLIEELFEIKRVRNKTSEKLKEKTNRPSLKSLNKGTLELAAVAAEAPHTECALQLCTVHCYSGFLMLTPKTLSSKHSHLLMDGAIIGL